MSKYKELDRTINKLKMVGTEIIGFNDFGLAYKDNKTGHKMLAKLTDDSGSISMDIIDVGTKKVEFYSDYIIINYKDKVYRKSRKRDIYLKSIGGVTDMGLLIDADKIYCAHLKNSIFPRNCYLRIFGKAGNIHSYMASGKNSIGNVIVVWTYNGMYAANYKGKKIRLEDIDKYLSFMVTCRNDNIYTIKCGYYSTSFNNYSVTLTEELEIISTH